jgi:hypothetical protein
LFYAFDCRFNVWHFIHLQFQVRQECFHEVSDISFTTSIILSNQEPDCKNKSVGRRQVKLA